MWNPCKSLLPGTVVHQTLQQNAGCTNDLCDAHTPIHFDINHLFSILILYHFSLNLPSVYT